MAIYETIPTARLAAQNELVAPDDNLPELVHLNDPAKSIYIDYARHTPATISPETAIDDAIQEMRLHHQHMLLVADNGQILGLIGLENILSEQPIRLMRENGIDRSEITVGMLMQPRENILVIDHANLKNAQVGHVLNTIKQHGSYYILVVKDFDHDNHIITGMFSASQLGKQLHSDLYSVLMKGPETIVELHKERKA